MSQGQETATRLRVPVHKYRFLPKGRYDPAQSEGQLGSGSRRSRPERTERSEWNGSSGAGRSSKQLLHVTPRPSNFQLKSH